MHGDSSPPSLEPWVYCMQRASLFCLIAMLGTVPAWAGDLRLSMQEGRVTLVAENVTVRQILDEWALVGKTRIVNAEKLAESLISLELIDVPEAEALATVLRSASGYLAAPRPSDSAGPSRFDRILILATSSAPPPAPPEMPTPNGLAVPGGNPNQVQGGPVPPRSRPPGFPLRGNPSAPWAPYRRPPPAVPLQQPRSVAPRPGPTATPTAPATAMQPGIAAGPEPAQMNAPTAAPSVSPPSPKVADPADQE